MPSEESSTSPENPKDAPARTPGPTRDHDNDRPSNSEHRGRLTRLDHQDQKLERRRRLRERRRLRSKRKRRRAYIRSVYSLPSLATLGNAVCGFASMYVASSTDSPDRFFYAALLIFLSMVFDALDGRLARFARHTTDFGGQLDSLADVLSFGAAPAFLALQLFKNEADFSRVHFLAEILPRLVWAIGALYVSCAAVRLARFNVSNQHGEQHHFSFLGLPSPGAAGAVAGLVLLHHQLLTGNDQATAGEVRDYQILAGICLWTLPLFTLATGLLMVSTIRYPHVVNRWLRGKRSVPRLLAMLTIVLLCIVGRIYTLSAGVILYSVSGLFSYAIFNLRRKSAGAPKADPNR